MLQVWLLLEEKRIPYRMEKVNMRCYGDKPPSFLKKVPSGLLPVIELDGRVVTESADIMALLESVRFLFIFHLWYVTVASASSPSRLTSWPS